MIWLVNVFVIVEFCFDVNKVIVNKIDKILEFVICVKIELFIIVGFDKVLNKLKNEGFLILLDLKMVIFIINNKELIKNVIVNWILEF